MKPKLLLLTLNTFSATGGIEKVCRTAAKALYEISVESGGELFVYAMHDGAEADEAYLPAACFKGFGGNRVKFSLISVLAGRKADTVLLSHVNLLPVGFLIKMLSPKTKLVLMAHGIEIWEPVGGWKKKMLQSVDLFLAVSSFTAQKLQAVHGIAAPKVQILNNCLDPYLKNEKNPALENALRKKYGIASDDFVLLTVTRLKFSEQYKGYDKVVKAMASLQPTHPHLKYLIVGKWDDEEKARLDAVIGEAGIKDKVMFAGFAKDEELSAHFGLADCYVMPSTGEGFGIVFIEALFYGLPVIAGNVDGSVDALGGGELGMLVNPYDLSDITGAVKKTADCAKATRVNTDLLIKKFGFYAYKKKWSKVLGGKANVPKKHGKMLAD